MTYKPFSFYFHTDYERKSLENDISAKQLAIKPFLRLVSCKVQQFDFQQSLIVKNQSYKI